MSDRNLGRASGFIAIGTVANVAGDPTQSGQARVKWQIGAAAQDQMQEGDLPWSKVLFHPANPSLNQTGGPHTGLQVGSQVVGVPIDGHGQDYLILGSIAKMGNGAPDGTATYDSDVPQSAKVQTNGGQQQPRYGDVNYVVTKSESIVAYGQNQGGTNSAAQFATLPDSIGSQATIA